MSPRPRACSTAADAVVNLAISAERRSRRKDDFDLLALVPFQRFARADPEAVHRLGLVVRAVLAARRAGEKKRVLKRRGRPAAVIQWAK
jgi:hypothetical protein